MTLLIIYCSVAIVFSFICSIFESVFLTTTQSFVESYAKKSPKIGGYLKYQKANIDETEGAILVLNTFAVTATSTGIGIELAELYGEEWQVIGSSIFAVVMIYVTEIFPKTLGAIYWKRLVPIVSVCIYYLSKVTFPFVYIAKFLMRVFSFGAKDGTSRDEILAASEIGNKGGALGKVESDMVGNLLALQNMQVADILTPRKVVFALRSNDTLQKVINEKYITPYSYIPVFEEDSEFIVGIVSAQKILTIALEGGHKRLVSEFVESVDIVPDDLSVTKLLNLFMVKRGRMFVVQDRYEQFFGIVTFEDVIEALLGEEIVDEFDVAKDMQELAKERQIRKKHQTQKKS